MDLSYRPAVFDAVVVCTSDDHAKIVAQATKTLIVYVGGRVEQAIGIGVSTPQKRQSIRRQGLTRGQWLTRALACFHVPARPHQCDDHLQAQRDQ
jgi:6,7-dimethyl-8-ribityllumazine synthase